MEKNDMKKIADSLLGSGGLVPMVMLVVIVVGSFFMGSLWTKVQILEKGGTTVLGAANVPATPTVAAKAPAAPTKVPVLADTDHVRGDKNATVVLFEYSDLECPFCKTYHQTAIKILDEYKGKVKWVYRHYPLSFHANAQKEAEASECVAELGGNEAFWKYIDAIYERTTANGSGFALEKLGPLAAEIGVNQEKFQTCLDSGQMTQKVKDQMAMGSSEGVTGTPGNILVNVKTKGVRLIPGALPFEQFKTVIDELLK